LIHHSQVPLKNRQGLIFPGIAKVTYKANCVCLALLGGVAGLFLMSAAEAQNTTTPANLKFSVATTPTFTASGTTGSYLLTATDYYVDPAYTGSTRNGSAAHPWQSLNDSAANPWQTINSSLASGPVNVYFTARQAASDTEVTSSAIVYLNRTDTSTNVLRLSGNEFYNTSESSPSWVAYTGTNKFHLATTGAAPAIDSNNEGTSTSRNYITIHGFKVSTLGQVMIVYGMSYLTVEYNEIYTSGTASIGPGLLIGQSSDSNSCPAANNWGRHITIQYNTIHDTFGEGLYINGSTADPPGSGCVPEQTGDDILITHNTFYNCGNYGTADGDCIDIKDGNTNVRFTYNTVYYDSNYRSSGEENCQHMTLESIDLVEGNFFYNTSSSTCFNPIAISSSWNNSFGRSGLTIRNNIIALGPNAVSGNSGNIAAIRTFGGATIPWSSIKIYNNSIYCGLDGILGINIESGSISSSGTLDVRNNIIRDCSGGTDYSIPGGISRTTHDYNLIWRSSGNISVSTAGSSCSGSNITACEAHSLSTDPKFTSTATPYVDTNFELQSGSPAISAGTTLTGFLADYLGNIRLGPWGMGAVQSASTPDLTAPSVPTNLAATVISFSQINLTWTASTDPDSAVAGYNVIRNGLKVGTSTGTSYSDTGLTASTSYLYTVSAFDPTGNVSVASSSVSATTLAAPATITATFGTPQSATVNTSFGTALAAAVKDSSNNPVPGVAVTFTAPGNGASGTFPGGLTTAVSITNSSGVATAPLFTANGSAGAYAVIATVAGASTQATFSLANTAGTAFTISDRGGASFATPGAANTTQKGYALVQPDGGHTAPAGLAIFGFRENGILISETSVPASPLIQTGRVYAEVNGPVTTGLAIANPYGQAANLSFYFTDSSGNSGNSGTAVLANGQIAVFFNQDPFNSQTPFTGSLTFTSSVPVSVIALRGLINERNEFLMTTLPVADLSAPSSSSTLVFPHFADGGGWTTQIALVNPTDSVLTGTVQFSDPSGNPAVVSVSGPASSSFSYSIPARSSQKLQTNGTGAFTTTGSVTVVPASTNAAPSGVGIFSFKNDGITVSAAGVPAVPIAQAFRLYAEAAGRFSDEAPGSIQTGIAVANRSSTLATVTLELFKLDGSSAGQTGTMVVPGGGHAAMFLNQISGFVSLQTPFQGVLRVSSAASISVAGLRSRYNERGDFLITTTPSVNEASLSSTAPLYFSHLADGGGYTTQFILFSGQAGQSSSGSLQLFTQSGNPLNLTPK
jgi:hypothetical protein